MQQRETACKEVYPRIHLWPRSDFCKKRDIMKIRSTGLGKTLLSAHVGTVEMTTVVPATLEASDTQPERLLMTMEVVEPVHWTVSAFLEPSDLRRLVKLVASRPKTLFSVLAFAFSKDPADEGKGTE